MSDLNQVLDAVGSVLKVIKTVADTPGVNLIPYVATASSAINALQMAVAVGKNIVPYVTAIKDTFTTSGNGIPAQWQLDDLNSKIAELESKIQAPMPPKEEGEPD